MKKNIHPIKNRTLIIFNNGSTIIKKWNFLKKILKTDTDHLSNKFWFNYKRKNA